MTVRVPRGWFVLGGKAMPVKTMSWTSKGTRSADSFTALLSITATERYGFRLNDWCDPQEIDCQLVASTKPGEADKATVFDGQMNVPTVDFDTMSVHIAGQDKSAGLTHSRRSEKFQNQRSNEVASKIAQDHGLTLSITGTSDFAGKVFDQDTVHLAIGRTDHEIISDLAEREGFRWYVSGKTLFFEPKAESKDVYPFTYRPPGTAAPYAIGDCWALKPSRNMMAARPHKVTVKSWHHEDKKLYTATKSAGGIGSDVMAVYHHQDRNQEQVEKLAQSRLDNAIRHDCRVGLTAVGDLAISAKQNMSLTGTGTIYDQTYPIDAVSFSLGWEQPFTMQVKSSAPKSGR